MSFQRFDSPSPSGGRTQSKRPHLSVFRFTSFQSTRRTPSQTPPAYSPNDVLASEYQSRAKLLHWLRIATSVVTLIASIITIACTARALQTYNTTRDNADWVLPLWPASVDLRPTHSMLACGVIIAVMSIFYIVAALAPTVRPSTYTGRRVMITQLTDDSPSVPSGPLTLSSPSLPSSPLSLPPSLLPSLLPSILTFPTAPKLAHYRLGHASGKALALPLLVTFPRYASRVQLPWTW